MTTIVSVAQGGTGSNSAALARTALGVPPSAAYDQANTARDQANTARTQANSAYSDANTRLSASGGTLAGDLIITGNLTVSGNSTTLNAEILTIEDADVVLLSNVASTPALNAGIIVNRGTSTNTFLRWDEVTDKWGWSDDGSTTYKFTSALDAYAQANAAYGAANNRVLKAGDTMTGQLNISSGGLLVTGNVGIGTASPAAKLDVVTSTEADSIRINNTSPGVNSGNKFGFVVRENGTDKIFLRYRRDGSGIAELFNTSDASFVLGANNTEHIRITSAGNLGVGATNPQGKLTISNAGAEGIEFFTTGGIGGGPYFNAYNRSTGRYVPFTYYANTHTFYTNTGSTRALDITTNGNIGVGTSSVDYGKVHIKEGGITAAAISTGWPAYNAEAATQSKYVLFLDAGSNGSVTAQGQGPSVTLAMGGYYDSRGIITMIGAGGGSPSDGGNGYGKDLMVKGGNSDNGNGLVGGRLFLAGGSGYSGGAYNANYGPVVMQPQGGNVGIGTSSPQSKLEVATSSGDFSHFGATSTTNGQFTGITLGYRENNSLYRKAAIVQEQIGDNSARGHLHLLVDIANDAGSVVLGDSKLMIHGTTGNIGIGTASPSQKLDVVGNIKASGTMAANGTIDVAGDGGAGYVGSRLILRTHDNYRGAGIFMVGETSAASNNTFYIGTPYSNHGAGLYFRHTANNYQTDYQSSAFTSAGNTIMYMTPAGQVTTPNQPFFYADTVANVSAAGSVVVRYTNVRQNRGTYGYNTSNGRFTAPIAGVYHFDWVYLYRDASTGFSIDDGYNLNGTFIYGGNRFKYENYTFGDGYVAVQGHATVYLNANDYFEVKTSNNSGSPSFYSQSSWGYLQGYLVG
jgi:hypothetical protein